MYDYDENDNLKIQTDAELQQIEFFYDELNRVTLKEYVNTSDQDITYTYDNTAAGANGIGELYTVSNTLVTTVNNAYDKMGRVLEVIKSIQGAPAPTYITSYEYDDSGKVTSRLLSY